MAADKKSEQKEASFHKFDMAYKEAFDQWSKHEDKYIELLADAFSGRDQSMGSPISDGFWQKFVSRMCVECNLTMYKDMVLSCKDYCESLKRLHVKFKNPTKVPKDEVTSIKYYSDEQKQKIISIFDCARPSSKRSKTSEGSSSNMSSSKSLNCSSYSRKNLKNKVQAALCKLVESQELDLTEVTKALPILINDEYMAHAFMLLSNESKVREVKKLLKQ